MKNLFPETEYPGKLLNDRITPDQGKPDPNQQQPKYNNWNKGVSVTVLGRKIVLKLPKNEADTRFIAGLKYSRWDGKQFYWTVPNYPGNLDLIKDYFKERITELIITEVKKTLNTKLF